MTIVARFSVQGHAFLVGDLMLSGIPMEGRPAIVPTISLNPLRFETTERMPRGLCQKLTIIGDHIAIGWSSDNIAAAQDLFGELRLLNEFDRLTERSLNEHLSRQKSTLWDELGIIGFIRESSDRMRTFSTNCWEFNSVEFGNVGAMGSGWKQVADYIDRETVLPTHENRALNAVELGISYSLQMMGSFLTSEIVSHDSLWNRYGAGYELATVESGRFCKLPSATFIHWHALYEGGESIRFFRTPLRAFRYAYYDDLLVVRAVEFEDDDIRAKYRHQTFPVRPVYRTLSHQEKYEHQVPDMNGEWLCNYVYLHGLDFPPHIITSIRHQPGKTPVVRFTESDGKLEVRVEPEFVETIDRQSKKIINRIVGNRAG
ncbi:MAG: hypothetical protein AB7G28_24630 [Pirellulales bacterium]